MKKDVCGNRAPFDAASSVRTFTLRCDRKPGHKGMHRAEPTIARVSVMIHWGIRGVRANDAGAAVTVDEEDRSAAWPTWLQKAEAALDLESHEEIRLFAEELRGLPVSAQVTWNPDLVDRFNSWALAEKAADESFDLLDSKCHDEEAEEALKKKHKADCQAADDAWDLCRTRVLKLIARAENQKWETRKTKP